MVSSKGDKSPTAGEKIMTDLEQFIKECEALGRRADNKRGKDKKPRVNSVALKTPKSTDVVVPVDMTKENPNIYFVADLPTSSDEVVIEIECPKDVKPVIPKWLSENAL